MRNGKIVGEVKPEKRIYTANGQPTTEAGILTRLFNQFYVSLGDKAEGSDEIVVRIWWKPMITLIWLGCLMMTIAGVISLSDRRLRIGAPVAAKLRQKPMPQSSSGAAE